MQDASRNPALWDDNNHYRRSLLRIMLWLMAAIALGLSLSNLSSHKSLGFILAEAGIGLYCLLFLARLKTIQHLRCWTTLLITLAFTIISYGIYSKALFADGFYWLMLLPPMSLLFNGLLVGGILSALFGVVGIGIMGHSLRMPDQSIDIPLFVNASVCYLLIWAICHVCEYRRIRVVRKLRDIASRDPLTGIYNRLHLEDVFSLLVQQHQQGAKSFALLLLDIDYFKRLNDQFGHSAGDQVLRELAARLKQICMKNDWRFRVGGEEFCILLPDCDRELAQSMAESLRQNVQRQPVQFHQQALPFTVSIGIAIWQQDGDDFDALYRQADQRLYHAKRCGRNRTVVAIGNSPRMTTDVDSQQT
ncbi:hypothetical protein HR45_02585 [Shewanella mangrovi]|uniref:diguanylate cyclase n=1 Tax=Shewanella mangrovi TaxID=1515746 RepID=A0A094JH39_9GAMM|nr:GGDEF domain-containing protein [Shewanella mangrovi]KFZ39290.1 hypothetical protein HR45_02585 [Shewanella mangrovi]